MRTILVNNAASLGTLAFVLLGWSFYMASRAVMSGSLFVGFRRFVDACAEARIFPFPTIRSMLGCLMCTSIELSLWTVGVLTLALGLYFHVARAIVAALLQVGGVVPRGQPVAVPAGLEFAVMAGVAVASSFAIAGEAWAIKTIVEHREEKFLALRHEFAERENHLRAQIVRLARARPGESSRRVSFDAVMIPAADFHRIYSAVRACCRDVRCPFSLTRCRIQQLERAIRQWGAERLEPAALEIYSMILSSALNDRTTLYWMLWGDEMGDAGSAYAELERGVRRALDAATPRAA